MPQSLKVLIVEDNPDDAELALAELRRAGFEPEWRRVDTESAYLTELNGDLDLVLSDYRMPGFNGFRALELLKQRGLDVPFILVSGMIGEDTAVAAMTLGAADYLLKDRLTRLGPAVAHALDETRLRRERLKASETLRVAQVQLGQLLEHSPAVLYALKLTDGQTVPELISENITALLGFTVAEAMDLNWWRGQLHPDDRERAVASGTETLTTGASLTEYRLRHKQGHYCWVDDARRAIRDVSGQPVELIGVWTEITERKRAEEIVRQASGHAASDRRKRVRIELGLLFAATAAVYLLAARSNWFGAVAGRLFMREQHELNETISVTASVVAGLAIFAFRRWRETESAQTSHQEVQAALGLLHEEMDRRVKQRTAELGTANQALLAEIAGHRRTETGLKESNRRFHEMLANVELIAMMLDQDGRVTFCNDFLLRVTGWKREEVIGHCWFDRFLPDSAADARQRFLATLAAGVLPSHHEDPIRTKPGELRSIIWNNTILRDGSGQPIGMASIGEDVTGRSRAESALRESEAQFRQVVENIREVFWMADTETNRILYVSPAYTAIWGRSCESLYADSLGWAGSICAEDRERVRQAKLTRGDYDETYRIARPGGEVRWIRDRAFPVLDQAGGIPRVVGTAEDITQYRTLEEQFRQVQKMEAVGTLAGGIAHDFNNILAAIVGYTELARMNLKENPTVQQYLAGVLRASSRATDLIRQILTFSRQQPPERRLIQLLPVVTETLALLRATIPSTIEFDTSLADDVPTVLADATQIHQILMNLGTNAWHAMKDRHGRLHMKLERWAVDAAEAAARPQLRPGLYARLSVGDTGCGMDEATLRRIFEPFFTTKPLGEGTGLGLAVVHGIMDSHDGAITVQSQPGKGTWFHLYFPAHVGKVVLPSATEGPVPRGRGEKILVVDDEEVLARLTQETLCTLGYEAEFATRPAAALARVSADPDRFALVLTDQTMPEMTGLALATQLRQIRPNLPVIVMTGYTASLMAERVQAAGVRQLLLKPATVLSLGNAVHAVLSPPPAGMVRVS